MTQIDINTICIAILFGSPAILAITMNYIDYKKKTRHLC